MALLKQPLFSTNYHVINGRHPTVEMGLLNAGRNFVPNNVVFNDTQHLQVITGPNMSGKSSLLRQTALIAILAQVGAFVPADRAELGLVDKVFSRVGAKDDLYRDRSTFMVEMLESAEILRRATPRSLVIMDEVGRGTTIKVGIAIAFASIHHLYHVNKCRALFATHFHEVADMLGFSETQPSSASYPKVGFYCTDLDELDVRSSNQTAYDFLTNFCPGMDRMEDSVTHTD
jgi:DNA mismatch repair ATPase MutS